MERTNHLAIRGMIGYSRGKRSLWKGDHSVVGALAMNSEQSFVVLLSSSGIRPLLLQPFSLFY